MRVFFDSSAIAKRYIHEVGTDRVLELCGQAESVILSQLAPIEVLSAASRLRRDGILPPSAYKRLKKQFGEDLAEVELVEVDVENVRLAIHALERAPLRTLDALQVAAAITSKCQLFVSSDIRQLRAAQVMKLKVEQV